jgi:hypothetical protein
LLNRTFPRVRPRQKRPLVNLAAYLIRIHFSQRHQVPPGFLNTLIK